MNEEHQYSGFGITDPSSDVTHVRQNARGSESVATEIAEEVAEAQVRHLRTWFSTKIPPATITEQTWVEIAAILRTCVGGALSRAFATKSASGQTVPDGNAAEVSPQAPPKSPSLCVTEIAEEAARDFHNTYERLAPNFGYETRKDTRQFDPTSANGRLMIAVCGEVLTRACADKEKANQNLRRIVQDGCEDEDTIKSLVVPILGEQGTYGDSYGVPTLVDLVEALITKLADKDNEIAELKEQILRDESALQNCRDFHRRDASRVSSPEEGDKDDENTASRAKNVVLLAEINRLRTAMEAAIHDPRGYCETLRAALSTPKK